MAADKLYRLDRWTGRGMFEAERGGHKCSKSEGKCMEIYMYIYIYIVSICFWLIESCTTHFFCKYVGNMGINWPQLVTSAFFDAINSMLGSFLLSTI